MGKVETNMGKVEKETNLSEEINTLKRSLQLTKDEKKKAELDALEKSRKLIQLENQLKALRGQSYAEGSACPPARNIEDFQHQTLQADVSSRTLLSGCFKELHLFHTYELPFLQSRQSGQRADLPVWCLRWTHDSIHSRMVFGSNRRQDGSIYEVVHDLVSERVLPQDLPPLQVVLDHDRLFSLSNRRLAALKMFQALRQHEVVRMPCDVYTPDDPQVRYKYKSAKKTSDLLGDGQGVTLHCPRQEAWHMGKPLFRCKQEWCDIAVTEDDPISTPECLDNGASSNSVSTPDYSGSLSDAASEVPSSARASKPEVDDCDSVGILEHASVLQTPDNIDDVENPLVDVQVSSAATSTSSIFADQNPGDFGVHPVCNDEVDEAWNVFDAHVNGWEPDQTDGAPESSKKKNRKRRKYEKLDLATVSIKDTQSPVPTGSTRLGSVPKASGMVPQVKASPTAFTEVDDHRLAVQMSSAAPSTWASIVAGPSPVELQESSFSLVLESGMSQPDLDFVAPSLKTGQPELDFLAASLETRPQSSWASVVACSNVNPPNQGSPSRTSGNTPLPAVDDYPTLPTGTLGEKTKAVKSTMAIESPSSLASTDTLESDEDVSKFIRESGLDDKAERAFLECSHDQQLKIMGRGSLSTADNPSAALQSRIRKTMQLRNAKVAVVTEAKYAGGGGAGEPPCNDGSSMKLPKTDVSDGDVMKFIGENDLDDKAAKAFLECARDHQLRIMKLGSLISATNQSACLQSRICKTRRIGNEREAIESHGDVTKFIRESHLDAKAERTFLDCPHDQQLRIIEMGPLGTATNPSSALQSRIQKTKSNGKNASSTGSSNDPSSDSLFSIRSSIWKEGADSEKGSHSEDEADTSGGPSQTTADEEAMDAEKATQMFPEDRSSHDNWSQALREALLAGIEDLEPAAGESSDSQSGNQGNDVDDAEEAESDSLEARMKQLQSLLDVNGPVRAPPGLLKESDMVVDSDSDEDIISSGRDDGEDDDIEGACEPCWEYESKVDLERQGQQQGEIRFLRDVKGKLVCGTFKCLSGSDFKNRRCRGELLVEHGPKALIGCRVFVVGIINRNRAWHFDRCWVRVLMAKVRGLGRASESLASRWDKLTSERTTLYGMVVRADESHAPRQRLVVCLRSRYVRSQTSMTFRPINGKFPMITVKWDPVRIATPSLFDLHVIEILEWKSSGLPLGRHVEVLQKLRQHGDCSLLYAVKLSLNFCDSCDRDDEQMDRILDAESVGRDSLFRKARFRTKRVQLPGPNSPVISIQHSGWPAGLAFSMPSQSKVHVHVVDVNEYLDSLDPANCRRLEEMIRLRSVGASFTDHVGSPVKTSLPFLPVNIENQASFHSGSEVLAITFAFQIDPKTGDVDLDGSEHFLSIVRCDHLYTFEAAGASIVDKTERDHAGKLMRAMIKMASNLQESANMQKSSSIFEHLQANFVPCKNDEMSHDESTLQAHRVIAACTYMVNRYAGGVLNDPQLWSSFCPPTSDDPDTKSKQRSLMPVRVHGRVDPTVQSLIMRLLQQEPGQMDPVGITAEDVIKVLQTVLAKPGLSHRQQLCVQSAFLRHLQQCFPTESYALVSTSSALAAWQGSTTNGSLQRTGQLFHREIMFSVAAPLRRHLDILGHRALKWASGWRPMNSCLRPTLAQLEEAVARTNMRHEAIKHASGIFKQVYLMRGLESAGRHFSDAVVGAVTPGAFDVLIPLTTSTHTRISVPISALRGSSCLVEYMPGAQSLKVSSNRHVGTSLQDRANWTIAPWGSSRLECVLSRNYAQPVPQHASLNGVIISDVTFTANEGPRQQQVTLGLGHRMYPEVFSSWPDLKLWYLINSDIAAYSKSWYAIRLCQIHAAASSSSLYTPRACAHRLEWFQLDGKDRYRCTVLRVDESKSLQNKGERRDLIEKGDLAVLRCTVPEKGEAVFYGVVLDAFANRTQLKPPRCTTRECNSPKCPFVHSNSEYMLRVEVQLSDISSEAKKNQLVILDAANHCESAFDVQFIPVPRTDGKSLELMKNLPKFIKGFGNSPIIAHLTGMQEPRKKQLQQEMRPLASQDQVARALQCPHFAVKGVGLNSAQVDGIKKGLQHPFSVVQGPPGTGKTTFLVHLTAAILNLETDPTLAQWARVRGRHQQNHQQPGRIMVCTPSNQAADEFLRRLIRDTSIPHSYVVRVYARSIEAAHGSKYRGGRHIDGRSDFKILPSLEEHSLHFKAVNAPSVRTSYANLLDGECSAAEQSHFDSVYEKAEAEILKGARVIITTCQSAMFHGAWEESNQKRLVKFATVIVDEAAQATEPDVVLPSLLAEERVVVVGDHKQLGPVVPEHNICTAYLSALETPMLERMHRTQDLLPANTMLDRQYRMHPSIRSFPSKQYYDSQLQDEVSMPPSEMSCVWPKHEERVIFIDSQHPHSFGLIFDVGRGRSIDLSMMENNTSVKNAGEAEIVAEVYGRLVKQCRCSPEDVAIITPYRAQQQEIHDKLEQCFGSMSKSTRIGTVYSLQGSERDYIIVSFVRSVVEGPALTHGADLSAATDTVVSVDPRNKALRQTCESSLGIVSNKKSLNVSLTRAKYGLVCIGNRTVLSEGSKDFFELTEDLQGRGCVFSEREFKELGRNV